MNNRLSLLLIAFFPVIVYHTQCLAGSFPFVAHPSQLDDEKIAEWIIPREESGVFLFRKTFEIASRPEQFVVHVSADARYSLFVNGHRVVWGPAVGDMENWNYETIDISDHLKSGKNIVAARVWNRGRLEGTKQISERTAFILQGDCPKSRIINSSNTWKVIRDIAYYGLEMTSEIAGGGYIAGGTDSLVAAKHPWGWNTTDFDDSSWEYAREIGKGNHSGLDTWLGTPWKLKPREIALVEEKMEHIPAVLKVTGMQKPRQSRGKIQFEIPANTRVEILLDNRVLTMGFPQLHVKGGKDSHIMIRYQEALWDKDGVKRNRNEWQGKTMKGIYDKFIADGGQRLLEPIWLRVFRYIEITVETGDSPLFIEDFYNIYAAYPLRENASFDANDPVLDRIWEASWRTARLCALESYWDCPYYEQVQYIGDTRIQALISMYVDGDDRLVRNAIEQFYASMQPMGLTKSAHPTSGVQIIPPFSLLFIGMIHDYYMLRDDPGFVRQFAPGIRFILEWFINRIDDRGIMGPLTFWNHIDGGTDFVFGSPPGISDGGSIHMTILLAYALDKANELLATFGFDCDVERFSRISASLKQQAFKYGYCPNRNLLAETPDKEQFSQHTNIFGILTGTFPQELEKDIMELILTDKSLIQTTLYFKFYLFKALKKMGMGEQTIPLMDDWKVFLDYGFTTFPEHGIHSRSDCHAWSAHPILAFLNIICGIESGSPGFQTVEIRPSPGNYRSLTGSVPHPLGTIYFQYQVNRRGEKHYTITLPEGLTGNLILEDDVFPLNGMTQIRID